jgi:hypothetical protein
VVIGLAIGGCGGPTASTRSFGGRVSDGTRRFNLTNPLRRHPAGVVVASDSLPDGVATFFGRMYRSSGRAYFILATEVEEATTHGLVAVSGGTRSLGAREYQTAALTIKHGCLAGHQFGLVYGVIRNPYDIVVAKTLGASIELRKKVLPTRLLNGTLVYASVGSGAVYVVIRAPDGRVLAKERYTGYESTGCT